MLLYDEKRQDYFSSARAVILDLLPMYSRRVLEVGCGSGETLEMLKQKKLCAETIGIELFPAAADAARNKVDEVYCMDIEKDKLIEEIGKFDLILILDVLEHLVDPWTVLRQIKEKYLAVGGKMVISLPNARHFSLVLPLLSGRFDYVERGILDKTHLRFFTKNSAIKLIEAAGLEIEEIKPTSLEIQLNSGKLNALTLGMFAGFITSQFIFRVATPKNVKKYQH